MSAAAIDPPGQKLSTAAKILDQKLYTSYSYIEGLSNPSGYRGAIEGLSRGYRARIGKCGKGSETAKNGLKPARRVALNDFGNTRTLTNAKNGPIFWGFELGSGVKREFVYNNLIYIDGIGSEFDIQIGEVMPGSGHLSRNDREHIEGKRSIFGNTKARGGPFKRLRSQMRSPFIR